MTKRFKKIVAVFGAHSPEPGSNDYLLAVELGTRLADAGFAVSTGGYGGTMEAVSKGAKQQGGRVIGISSIQIENFRGAKLNPWVTEEIRYNSLEERIHHLVRSNDAMIVLPGGIGTLTELAFSWNLMQVGELPTRPLVLLGEMWRETIFTFIHPEFVAAENEKMIDFAESPQQAVEIVSQWMLKRLQYS